MKASVARSESFIISKDLLTLLTLYIPNNKLRSKDRNAVSKATNSTRTCTILKIENFFLIHEY